jgi:hypothetical protein
VKFRIVILCLQNTLKGNIIVCHAHNNITYVVFGFFRIWGWRVIRKVFRSKWNFVKSIPRRQLNANDSLKRNDILTRSDISAETSFQPEQRLFDANDAFMTQPTTFWRNWRSPKTVNGARFCSKEDVCTYKGRMGIQNYYCCLKLFFYSFKLKLTKET